MNDKVTVLDEWIHLSDGTRLHARIWRTVSGKATPALLEYLPYRLDDWTSVRDHERHPWYAEHGYASIRVDIRGTGSSEGLFDDEYSEQELDDGVEIIEWIARQSWCTGAVGMFGISWGGFNSLQLAARAPEALKAIVTVCSTDDRYDNDVHYFGGAMLGIDMAAWGGTMLAFNSRPPRPEVVGEQWVEQWRERLDHNQAMTPIWLSHQERDDYWRRGSVCEDYSAISAAVLAVGGWADPYRDSVFRLIEHLDAPTAGLIGPWSHHYPDRGYAPGPHIDFLGETLRWWDRWLKDIPQQKIPSLRAWISESEPPSSYYSQRRGRWVSAESWPSARTEPRRYSFADSKLGEAPAILRSPLHTGVDAGRFFAFGNSTDLPPDQRAEDGRSICFDFLLPERLEMLGNAVIEMRVTSDRPDATLVVRLCDVAPDGSSTLITRGALNLNKRNGMDRNDPMVPGTAETVRFPLVSIGHAFPAGHRMRIAVSSQYWPWVWPHSSEPTVDIDPLGSHVTLPEWPLGENEWEFDAPVPIAPLEIETFVPSDPRPQRTVSQDVATGTWTLDVDPGYGGSRVYPDGLTFTEESRETYTISEHDPLSAAAESHWRIKLEGASGWHARLETRSRITADAEHFRVENRIMAWASSEGEPAETLVAEHSFDDRVKRTST